MIRGPADGRGNSLNDRRGHDWKHTIELLFKALLESDDSERVALEGKVEQHHRFLLTVQTRSARGGRGGPSDAPAAHRGETCRLCGAADVIGRDAWYGLYSGRGDHC